jgi:hypothetical protein
MKRLVLVAGLALGLSVFAQAGVIDRAQQVQSQTWSAWGGQIGVHWNADLLAGLGISVRADESVAAPTTGTHADFRPHTWFALRQAGGLDFTVRNGALQGFNGGALTLRGGYQLTLRDGSTIDLRNVTLRTRKDNPNVLDVVSGDGHAWFYSDRIMFELVDRNRTLAVRAADLRMSHELANRLATPELADTEIADMTLNTQVFVQGADESPSEVCTPFPWPNVDVPNQPGQTYKGDLFMQTFSVSAVGCEQTAGGGTCDGPGGTDGIASLAPSSTLINNKNDGTSVATVPGDPLGTSTALHTGFIAWWTMFSGSNLPYNNDQHPFLIWNMYRTNSDGSIEQIGRSGVKHAFVTTNGGCLDACNHLGGHALGRGCSDTYGVGNNDSASDMGPRSEIVPAKGIWGRCGSIWDPNCTGSEQGNGNSSWTQRMQTHESQIDPAANAGASYMFESWYVARDDINIYNSMATITGTPTYSAGSHEWNFSGSSNYKLGPAVDRWVSPTSPPANARNMELATSEGHAKVAVKATNVGGNNWRYDYAVENLDFARAVLQDPQNGPDPHVVSNKGFDSFSVPIPAGATVSSTSFHNGLTGGSGAWAMSTGANSVTWTANGQPTLDWGTMYSFSVTVNAPPSPLPANPLASSSVTPHVTMHVATAGSPSQFIVTSVVPAAP